MINKNSEFIFGFEAMMSNPNGDPDQENKPRMDYETSTLLVSDARRKRDIRDFLFNKGYKIFVNTLNNKKVPMDVMLSNVIEEFLTSDEKVKDLLDSCETLKKCWPLGNDIDKYLENYKNFKKDKKKKSEFADFNSLFVSRIIENELIDIRMFGSAMAIEGVSKTFTGPIQMTWGYSLHPCELVKSNTITTIMNDDSSTFGKKYQVYYALVAHHGTVNKFAAKHTGMREEDKVLFRKALTQGMMNNLSESKQGQTPLFYLEIIYKEDFDGYLGDLRRFIKVDFNESSAIRKLQDLTLDFSKLTEVIGELKEKGYVEKVIGWVHPYAPMEHLVNLPELENVDLWQTVLENK
ncbi:MAG: type I CRISPR-associated protein Cas7 [Halanaerobiales bacterium]|nr:type I CRISPR-associated protein Cas7 [Halanaerobiales bacterium]